MYISVLPDSDTPAYKQIYEQISGQILSGAFPPGSVLPPIRAVANEIGTSVVTVRSAWELLENEITYDEMTEKLLEKYNVSRETAKADLDEFLGILRKASLLDE